MRSLLVAKAIRNGDARLTMCIATAVNYLGYEPTETTERQALLSLRYMFDCDCYGCGPQ